MPIRTDRITPIKKHTNKKSSIAKALEESQSIESQHKKEHKKQPKKIQPLRNSISKLIQAKNDLEIESATINSILKQENNKETIKIEQAVTKAKKDVINEEQILNTWDFPNDLENIPYFDLSCTYEAG